MKRIIYILLLIVPFIGKSQTYDPTKAGTALNKGIAVRGIPVDSRSYYYDATTFSLRPFTSTAEVLSYFNTAAVRAGNFNIYVTVSGIRRTYQFRDGTADGNLVLVDNIDATAGVTSVNNLTGVVTITQTTVGLPNVTNESKATMFTNPTFTGIANIPSGSILLSPRFNTTSTLNYVWTSNGTNGAGSWQPTQAIGGTVTTINGSSGAVTIGFGGSLLPNVQNTLDLDKPISTATQTALDAKATAAGLSSHIANLANPHSTTATQVGLGNVTNTSDAAKPVSTLQQAALDLKANAANPAFSGTSTGTWTIGGTVTFPSTVTQNASSQIITNKIINGSSNTLSNVGTISNTPASTTVAIGFSTGTGTTLPAATHSVAGVLTAADKTRLDSNYYASQSATGVPIVYFTDAQNIRYKPLIAGSGIQITNNGDTTNTVAITGASTAFQQFTDGATITLNCSNGLNWYGTLGGNRTLVITNASDGMYISIQFIQDGSGNRTITLPAGSKVINGGAGALTLSTASGAIDWVSGVYRNTTWFFSYGKNFN